MKTVSISEARNNLAELVNLVAYGSEQVLIEKMGKPVATLVNIDEIDRLKKLFRKKSKSPSEIAGTISLPKSLSNAFVLELLKEPYDKKSLLGC